MGTSRPRRDTLPLPRKEEFMKLPCRCAGQPAAWVSFDNGTGVNQCTPQNNTGCHLTSFLQLCSKSHCSHMLTVLGGHLSASLPELDLS